MDECGPLWACLDGFWRFLIILGKCCGYVGSWGTLWGRDGRCRGMRDIVGACVMFWGRMWCFLGVCEFTCIDTQALNPRNMHALPSGLQVLDKR